MMNEAWRNLRVGDRVRIVRMPSDYSKPGYVMHEETVAVYHYLIDSCTILIIKRIDEYGHPWTEPFHDDGTPPDGTGHSLALNDDSWERV